MDTNLARRLRRLPATTVCGRRVRIAAGAPARLLGLALLEFEEVGAGLLIPSCSSVHTFGMRFALDLVFLDRGGEPCSVRCGVPPRRLVSDRRASAVLELPSEVERAAGGRRNRALCGHGAERRGESYPPR